jgi:integrase
MNAESCNGLGLSYKATGPTFPGLRSFAEHEVACFWAAAGQAPDPCGTLFKILLLTGIRPIGATGARCTDVDFSERIWNLPGWPYPLAMPLTAEAERLLGNVCRDRARQDERLFRPGRGGAISGAALARARSSLAETMDDICRRNFAGRTIAPWGIPALRFTVRSWLTYDRGRDFAELVLGQTNDRSRRLSEFCCEIPARRDGLQAWETAVMAIVGGDVT